MTHTQTNSPLIMLTPEQADVALQKLLAERQRASGADRLLRAVVQLLGRFALASFLASLLFIRDSGRVAIGFVLMAILLGFATIVRDRVADVERHVAGQAAAQRLGLRRRLETELAALRSQTWYWIGLLPLYFYLLVAQWTGWPRPWWLYALGVGVFIRLVYDAARIRVAERHYLESVVELEQLLKARQAAGEACLSPAEAERLHVIEERQTQRLVVQALMQEGSIPLAAIEEELWSTIRAAHDVRLRISGRK